MCSVRCGQSQRGAGLLIVLFLFIGIGISGTLLQSSAQFFEQQQKKREQDAQRELKQARKALLDYLLLRADNELRIAQGTTSINSRRLMLLCPDNVNDSNLDGSQEGGCRGAGTPTNRVNGILDNGSRFGRLPWRSRHVSAVSQSINDGLEIDTRDAAGNRFWYALTRNMAQTGSNIGGRLPLNLHRLMTHTDDWLTVQNQYGEVVSNRVAAVILAPGASKEPRLPESVLQTAVFNYTTAVTAPNAPLAPRRYFESYAVRVGGVTQTVANYDTDGVFVQAPPDAEQGFNDMLTYISIDQLATPRGAFARSYARLVGTGERQNAPQPHRALWQTAQALQSYYALFGFYPPPARQRTVAHVSTRQRSCASFHSGVALPALTIAASVTVAAAAPLTVYTAGGGTVSATVQLAQRGAFLLQQAVTLTIAATVEYNDLARTVALLTIARYARLTLANVLLQPLAGGLQSVAATVFRLSAFAPVRLVSAAAFTLAAETPLAPQGALVGWLGEHYGPPYQRAGNDGQDLVLQADTRAMFWSDAQLTAAAVTVTATSGDVLTLAAGSSVRLEEDIVARQSLSARIFYQDGQTLTITVLTPSETTYAKRQFAVWLLADALRSTTTITAPAVLFPWRQRIGSGGANTRDNLHSYPPCFDARNFFGQRLETELEDQTLVYAVAADCHYGGNSADCGRHSGFTVSIAAGVEIALPQAIALTHSYTVTVGSLLTLELQNGVLQSPVSLYRSVPVPLPASGGGTLLLYRLPADTVLSTGVSLTLPAGTAIIGGEDTVLEQVPALLAFSPTPLPRVACTIDMSGALAGIITSPLITLTVATQQAPASDITSLCYWLDDTENADADNFYVIYPPRRAVEEGTGLSRRNDYFILLGGRLRTS